MINVLASTWALLLGVMLLQVGNGMQGTLLGVRGGIEGFSTFELSLIMSGYFVGFLFGSRRAPEMIRRVGHVRVFAALASLISAIMLFYPTWTNPWAWGAARVLIGFCFSGVYVTAESWLNNAASNENRGKALSLYMIVQSVGIVSAQALMLVADPGGFVLFIIPSVLISLSFAPILLSISPTPSFTTSKPMTLRQVMQASPLACVGTFLLGAIFSAQFGMSAVYGARMGLSVPEISVFVASFYVGGLLIQYPLGWLSDRMDRRLLIVITSLVVAGAALLGMLMGGFFPVLLVAAFLVGGMTNPLYSLMLAYINDYLDQDDMASASAGMIFINGLGSIMGPLITGWSMDLIGPPGFFVFIAVLGLAIAGYAAYRMTQRAAPAPSETDRFAPVTPILSSVGVAVVQEAAQETAQDTAPGDDTPASVS